MGFDLNFLNCERAQCSSVPGCTRDLATTSFYCKVASYDGRHTHARNQASSQYAFECCKEDRCNGGKFPELPPVPGSELAPAGGEGDGKEGLMGSEWKILLAVLFAILLVVVIGICIFCCVQERHKVMSNRVWFSVSFCANIFLNFYRGA